MDSTMRSNAILEYLSKYNYTVEQVTTWSEEDQTKLLLDLILDIYSKKSVWFTISENLGKYSITLYYDNMYNHANGEDL